VNLSGRPLRGGWPSQTSAGPEHASVAACPTPASGPTTSICEYSPTRATATTPPKPSSHGHHQRGRAGV